MAEIALLYPGQGSQRVGMGAAILEERPDLLEPHLAIAEEVTGLPLREVCLSGPMERLTATNFTQPAVFAVSLALSDYLRELGIRPVMVAGHSLGEYTAAVAAGAMSPADGVRLVCERGRLMMAAQAETPGAMGAISELDSDAVERLTAEAAAVGVVVVANLNGPQQTVVSGEEAAVERALELARAAGGRTVRLQVGAAFHSPLMEPVRQRLAELVAGITFVDPAVPVVSNDGGRVLRKGSEIAAVLVEQITRPVQWVSCVRSLASSCNVFLELGPGRVMSGLVRLNLPEATAYSADSPARLRALAESLGG